MTVCEREKECVSENVFERKNERGKKERNETLMK